MTQMRVMIAQLPVERQRRAFAAGQALVFVVRDATRNVFFPLNPLGFISLALCANSSEGVDSLHRNQQHESSTCHENFTTIRHFGKSSSRHTHTA